MARADTPARRNGRTEVPEREANGDWAAQAADAIERVVGSVRDKTTGPALVAARGVVYGTFAAFLSLAAVVLLAIAAVRLVDNYLPDAVFGEEHTWAAHLVIGLAFVAVGGTLWARRHPPDREHRAP